MKRYKIVIYTIIVFSVFLWSIDEATIPFDMSKKVDTISFTTDKNDMMQLKSDIMLNGASFGKYKIKGPVVDGLLDGYIKIWDDSKRLVFEGDMKEGVIDGHARIYDKCGILYEGYIKDGIIDGYGKHNYYEDGVLRWTYMGDFKSGKKNGYGKIIRFDDDLGLSESTVYIQNDVYDAKLYPTNITSCFDLDVMFAKSNAFINTYQNYEDILKIEDDENLIKQILKKKKQITKTASKFTQEINFILSESLEKMVNNKKNKVDDIKDASKNKIDGDKRKYINNEAIETITKTIYKLFNDNKDESTKKEKMKQDIVSKDTVSVISKNVTLKKTVNDTKKDKVTRKWFCYSISNEINKIIDGYLEKQFDNSNKDSQKSISDIDIFTFKKILKSALKIDEKYIDDASFREIVRSTKDDVHHNFRVDKNARERIVEDIVESSAIRNNTEKKYNNDALKYEELNILIKRILFGDKIVNDSKQVERLISKYQMSMWSTNEVNELLLSNVNEENLTLDINRDDAKKMILNAIHLISARLEEKKEK